MAGADSIMHTPGPWRIDVREAAPLRVLATDARATIVASDLGNPHSSTAMADARLIAAAPDLLAALQEAREALAQYADADQPSGCDGPIGNAAMKAMIEADHAIAKAEGKT